jgi:hypothetical protein
MNTIDSEFGFEEYISTTNYMPKLENFDGQLYPSGKQYLGSNDVKSNIGFFF